MGIDRLADVMGIWIVVFHVCLTNACSLGIFLPFSKVAFGLGAGQGRSGISLFILVFGLRQWGWNHPQRGIFP